MDKEQQMRAPVYEALEKLKKRRVVPFDVPGHKRGRGNPELVELLGEKCVSLDVNSMKPLDNLCHPVSVIKEAEELAAEAFRAEHAFFMVGGTTSSVQGMVLSCCKAGDKIILPRNVHKSVINALVLCGAIPVYVNPEVDVKLGISLGMQVSEVERAILENPGGSLTQSSLLLTGKGVNWEYVSQIINLTQTTSASYLLMSSLDISRRNLALRGKESFAKVAQMAEYARDEINSIGGFYAYGKDMVNGGSVYDFDVTKLSVYTRDIGLAGIEVYDLLRDEYDIQIELGDIANILAYISIGDRIQDIERLVGALADIKRLYSKDPAKMLNTEYINPKVLVSPQVAFYSQKESMPVRQTAGRICGEFVMCYPPGIPILAPGEMITPEIIEYIVYAKEKGCSMQGTEDPEVENLNVLAKK